MALTRDQILSHKPDLQTVPVPEWGGDIKLRRLTPRQRLAIENDFAGECKGQRAVEYMARVVIETAVDDEYRPLFTPEDIAFFLDTDWHALERVSDAAFRHNKLNAQIITDAKKNSDEPPNGD